VNAVMMSSTTQTRGPRALGNPSRQIFSLYLSSSKIKRSQSYIPLHVVQTVNMLFYQCQTNILLRCFICLYFATRFVYTFLFNIGLQYQRSRFDSQVWHGFLCCFCFVVVLIVLLWLENHYKS